MHLPTLILFFEMDVGLHGRGSTGYQRYTVTRGLLYFKSTFSSFICLKNCSFSSRTVHHTFHFHRLNFQQRCYALNCTALHTRWLRTWLVLWFHRWIPTAKPSKTTKSKSCVLTSLLCRSTIPPSKSWLKPMRVHRVIFVDVNFFRPTAYTLPTLPCRVLYRSGHSVGLTESDVDSVSRFFFFYL